jgi:hypothetical protein
VARRRPAFWLALIVLAAWAFGALWTTQIHQWEFMVDELLYERLGISIFHDWTLWPTVHEEHYSQFTLLYPLLIAPFYGVLPTPAAYDVIHVINPGVMASAGIPAYLLTRDLTESRHAPLLAAALTAFAPWLVMSRFVMTEVVAYPAFVWALLAMQRAVARPGPRSDALALAAIGVAFLARTQFLILGLALPVAIGVHELVFAYVSATTRRIRAAGCALVAAARAHWLLVLAVGVVALVLAGLEATGGATRVLGDYSGAVVGDVLPHGIRRAAQYHVAVLVVGIGVLPAVLAGAFVFGHLLSPAGRERHAFAVLLPIVAGVVVLQSASFNVRIVGALVQERYAFYVVPGVFAAAAAFLAGPRPRMIPGLVIGALATAWAVHVYEQAGTIQYSYVAPWHRVVEWWSARIGDAVAADLGSNEVLVAVTVVAAVIVLIAGRSASPRTMLLSAGLPVLAYLALETGYVMRDAVRHDRAALVENLNWVDDAVAGERVAIVPGLVGTVPENSDTWWDVEFWNRSISRQFMLEPSAAATQFPSQELTLDWSTGALAVEQPVRWLVLPANDRRFRPVGRIAEREGRLVLMHASRPLRAAWATRGIDRDGWSEAGQPIVIRVFPSRSLAGRRYRVGLDLTSTADIDGPRAYTIHGGERTVRGTVAQGAVQRLAVLLCVPRGRDADLRIAIRGHNVIPTGRDAGLALTRVQLHPLGAC